MKGPFQKKDLDYDAYATILLSTASDYDSKHTVNKGKRQVYAHDHTDHDDEVASYETYPFDIDTPADIIQAFMRKCVFQRISDLIRSKDQRFME
jgi:hypothetical protein